MRNDEMQVQVVCPSCKTNDATIHPKFGVLPCTACKERQENLPKSGGVVEMTTESIKQQRKEFFDDYHPAHRNGQASAEYRDRWGKEAMKRQGFSDEEIKKARPVWNSDKYYKR